MITSNHYEQTSETLPPAPSSDQTGIVGSGEMAEQIRCFDWGSTSLGEVTHWPTGMLSHVNTILASPVPTAIMWGPDFVTLYNDAYCQILCHRHPKALGVSAREVWQEIWAKIGPQYDYVYQRGASVQEKEVMIPLIRDGVPRDFFWDYSVSPLYVAKEVVGVITTGQNVTDTVVAMESLAQTQERLRIALSATGCIGMWDWHVQEDLVFADEGFALAYGTDPDQSAGNGVPIAEFLKSIHPDDLKHVHEGIVKSINSGADFLDEYRLIQKDGSQRWVEARGRCILGEDGRPLRFPGVTIDISGRKLMEEALAKGLINALPEDRQDSSGLRDTFSTLQELSKSPNAGELGLASMTFFDEEYLKGTSELIARDLAGSSSQISADRSSFVSDLLASSLSASESGTRCAPAGVDQYASLHQRHLLYGITMLLNDWVRSTIREEQESERVTKLVH